MKIIATNRKARKDYQILENFEVGIELRGTEVKSLRSRACSIEEAFVKIEAEEAYIYNMHVPEFVKSSFFKEDPKRTRKLLLHKRQIKKLIGLTSQKGLTIVPLKVYFNQRGLVKMEVALAKGRRLYDKRRKIKEEITDRETRRALKKHRKIT